jgi:hypothetical protein
LADWQREVGLAHPGRFLRGLFNSDGCRVANWAARPLAGDLKRYEYPRYLFSNESADIMAATPPPAPEGLACPAQPSYGAGTANGPVTARVTGPEWN